MTGAVGGSVGVGAPIRDGAPHASWRLRGVARQAVRYLAWPALFFGCVALTPAALASDLPFLAFNAIYLTLGLTLFVLERAVPWHEAWLVSDGQERADLLHTLLNKGSVQLLAITAALFGAGAAAPAPGGLWPHDWPLWAQVALSLVLAEFGLYWAHRLEHTTSALWRFHAVHHSVRRLWFWNTGRFHFVDSLDSILLSVPILLLAGAPEIVFQWYAAITAYIGLMTHCNVDMRCGPLNLIFNTPQLHRWHHYPNNVEGNTNLGENLVLWDQIFGSYHNPPQEPVPVIGVKDDIPAGFRAQLAAPFRWHRHRRDRADRQPPATS